MGKGILVPSFLNRKFNGIIRIYANEPNTKLYRDAILFDSIPFNYNDPATSYIERRVFPKKDSLGKVIQCSNAVISSNNKININYLNPGYGDEYDSGKPPDMYNDPFSLELIPMEYFSNSSEVIIPADQDSAFFPQNYATIIFETDTNLIIPEDISITRIINNNSINEKLSDFYTGIIEQFKIMVEGKYYNKISINLKTTPHFVLNSSKNRFIVYAYGYDFSDAYAYSRGRSFNQRVIPPEPTDSSVPLLIGELDCYGNIEDGIITDSLINSKSRIKSIEMDSSISYNYNLIYKPDSLNVDRVAFSLTVIDPEKDARAEIIITDYKENDTTYIFEFKANQDKIKIVYPVPSKDKIVNIQLYTCTETSAKIEIWDYIGKKCKTFDNLPLKKGLNKIPLNLHELSFSAYFLVIIRPEPRTIHKIILVN